VDLYFCGEFAGNFVGNVDFVGFWGIFSCFWGILVVVWVFWGVFSEL